jgi:ABC-type lipoprotein export system ATPase subunit
MISRWLRRDRPQENRFGDIGPPPPHLIELHHVVKQYHNAAGSFTALHEINVHIDRGEFVAVIGKSGSGKSTLINTITGIDRPTSGEVLVDGTPIHTMSEEQLAVWRGKTIGVVFQFFQLLPTLSVIENVMLPMDFCHMYPPQERRERARQLLALVDMAEHADKLPSALSGGQQQRVAIARALANDPPIIVADEPTGNLDSKTAAAVFDLFARLVAQGKTILMVTHDQDLAQRVTRTILLADGEIIDEYVAKALPGLTADQLVELSYHLEPQSLAPGAIIIHEGEPADQFYIITEGRVEVVLHDPDGPELVVASLGPGQYVGEVELLHGGTRIATVRAARDSGAAVVALDRESFMQLVEGSATLLTAIDQVADARAAENAAAREQEAIDA